MSPLPLGCTPGLMLVLFACHRACPAVNVSLPRARDTGFSANPVPMPVWDGEGDGVVPLLHGCLSFAAVTVSPTLPHQPGRPMPGQRC